MRFSSLVPSPLIRSIAANAGQWAKKVLTSLAVMVVCLSCTGMASLSDEELSNESGQALFQMDKQVIGGITYYSMNLDVILALNVNIANLQLGRTAALVNGKDTDISATNVSFGCIADAANNCITSGTAGDTAVNRVNMKDFTLTRPYMQFAMTGDDSAINRHVVGVRLGAQSVNGPLSFGTLSSFSGYLSGITNIAMLGTCAPGSPYCPSGGNYTSSGSGGIPATPPCGTANGSNSSFPACSGSNNWVGEPAGAPGAGGCGTPAANLCQSMGLPDSSHTFFGTGAWMHELAIGFGTQVVRDNHSPTPRTDIPVEAIGQRIGFATIPNVNFSASIEALLNDLNCNRTTNGYGCGLIEALLPVLQDGVRNSVSNAIKRGMDPAHCAANGSGTGCGTTYANLNALSIPYNLKNIHQLNIDTIATNGTFGLSFQSQALTYPGYVDANGAAVTVQPGWALYANKAFTLPIANYTWVFTQNITNGAARNGNIVPLPGPYVNCWGTATFC